jgi:hypothetical protein
MEERMTIAEQVSGWLKQKKSEAYCDDCIQQQLKLSRRQQAFRVTSALGTTSDFKRQTGSCSLCGKEKLVTQAV